MGFPVSKHVLKDVSYNNSLRAIDSTTKTYRSYEQEICKIYGIPRAMFVEWIAYHCGENLKKGLEFSVYHTQRNLSALFNCSRATLNNWIKRLKDDDIIIVDKNIEHNCRQNSYTLGPKYYQLLDQYDSLPVQQLDKDCQQVRQGVSNCSTPLKIYNIHTKIRENNVVFFPEKIIEEKAQDMMPIHPLPEPVTPSFKSIPFPIPNPDPDPDPKDPPKDPEKRKRSKSSGGDEDQAFEEQWKFYGTEAPKYGITSIGNKSKARNEFKKVYREEGAEQAMFLMTKFFEWKDSFKQKNKFCESPPHLERFYRHKYYKDEQLMKFIEDQKPVKEIEHETLQGFDDSKEGEFRKNLFQTLGKDVYKSWYKDVILSIENNKVLIKTKNLFIRDTLRDNPSYDTKVREVTEDLFPGSKVEYVHLK